MNKQHKYILLILIPLILSAYTHLWNLLGFPSIHIDEGHYMRRAMWVLEGMGPQESAATGYPRTYDHPYFGQLLLAGALGLVGYPDVFNPGSDVQSIEILHLVPRVFMGLLAIVDTFILFKIAERRYNTTIALIAGILFAVMPMTWIFRRVYLDTILVPFLLSAIFIAFYLKEPKKYDIPPDPKSKYRISKNVLILLSGIFLGLAIYTKIPAFTFIPLVGTIIFFNSGKSLRSLAIWFIPVIILPLLWPLYSIIVGQSDLWIYWVIWQTGRENTLSLSTSLTNFLQIDPIVMIMGIAGMVLAAIRKDFLPLLWISPFLIFSYFVGWLQYFHLLPIFPAFCLASAILIDYLQKIIAKYTNRTLSCTIILFISVFGIVTTAMLISLDVNSSYYEIYSTIAEHMSTPTNQADKVTLIGNHWWIWQSHWIMQYALDKPHDLLDPKLDPKYAKQIKTEKVLFVEDPKFLQKIARKINSDNLREIRKLHNESNEISTIMDNATNHTSASYPYNTVPIMILREDRPIGKIVIKSNFD